MPEDSKQKTVRLSRLCRVLILSAALCPLSSALAASPGSVTATYAIYKGGVKIAQIDETFTREKDLYSLVSTTRSSGFLAILKPGKIVISSSGSIRNHGLQPVTFNDFREGEERKSRRAEFDWDKKQLTLIPHAQRIVVPLPDGTQDRLSAMYQFMFLQLEKADKLNFHMTNGSKLDLYNYRITANQSVTVPLGTFKALYVDSVPEAGGKRTEIWLAVEHANFPYKMVITDPDGGVFTQELTKINIVP